MKFSTTGQGKGDCLIEVTARAGFTVPTCDGVGEILYFWLQFDLLRNRTRERSSMQESSDKFTNAYYRVDEICTFGLSRKTTCESSSMQESSDRFTNAYICLVNV